ncbi:hypothetical protein C8J45_10468 [Sphingomonas sp. PP-CE-3G-477]|nr:hypothetical protein C8J45_10468 [Sphingomonas sp. PP-CE-3G-477]
MPDVGTDVLPSPKPLLQAGGESFSVIVAVVRIVIVCIL